MQDFPKCEWRLSLSKPVVVPEAAFDTLSLRFSARPVKLRPEKHQGIDPFADL